MPSSGFQTCALDRKSTRLNSSHTIISYAVFCLKKQEIFNRLAFCYDFLNRSITACIDVRWRKKAILLLKDIQPQMMLFFLMIRGPPKLPIFPYPPPFQ